MFFPYILLFVLYPCKLLWKNTFRSFVLYQFDWLLVLMFVFVLFLWNFAMKRSRVTPGLAISFQQQVYYYFNHISTALLLLVMSIIIVLLIIFVQLSFKPAVQRKEVECLIIGCLDHLNVNGPLGFELVLVLQFFCATIMFSYARKKYLLNKLQHNDEISKNSNTKHKKIITTIICFVFMIMFWLLDTNNSFYRS